MHGRWPDNAQCVVTLTVDFDGTSKETGLGQMPLGKFSHGRYSARRGVPRYLGLFKKHRVPATFFVPGFDAEQTPDVVRAISDAGHDVGAHGYLHESFSVGDQEPILLRKTHRILTEVLGRPPVGWRTPGGGKSLLTLRTLKELNYIYDSSEKDNDLPFFPEVDGEVLMDFINLPDNTSSLDDFPFYRVSYTPPSEVLAHWKQEFDATYKEGGLFDLIVHPRTGFGSGSPTRAGVVDQLIDYIKTFPGIVFFRMDELARWCIANPHLWEKGSPKRSALR